MASQYDLRMQEIARMKAAERSGLDRIAESTATINRGTSDPLNWILAILAIAGIPFTGGLSIGLAIIVLLRMSGNGKAYVQAIPPTTADLAAPGPGCVRILAALGSLVILLLVAFLFAVVLYMHATGIPVN